MATYYWRGGQQTGSIHYETDEGNPDAFCWNVPDNWLIVRRTSRGGGVGDQKLLPATTAPGGGDTVIFKRFTLNELSDFGGPSHACPRSKCGFGGYWGTGGWINASNTGGTLKSFIVDENYGYGDIWKEGTNETLNDGEGVPLVCGEGWYLEGPSSAIGFDDDADGVAEAEATNLKNDYVSNYASWRQAVGVPFPSGITGFHRGIRVKVSGVSVLNDSREYGSGIAESGFPDNRWGGRCRINLFDSDMGSLVVKSENTKIRMMGGTAEQVIIDEPSSERAINGLEFISLKNGETAGDESGVMPAFTNYFYVGNFTGSGQGGEAGVCTNTADRGRHNGYIYMNNHYPVTLNKLVVNTPYAARFYVGPTTRDYESGIVFSTSATTVDIFPQRKEEFDWVSPNGTVVNETNIPYYGHTGVIFRSLVDYDGCTLGTVTLHPSSPDGESLRSIYRLGDEDVPAREVNNIVGINNLLFCDTPADITTLNIDGGRFVVGAQLSRTQVLGRTITGQMLIRKGRVQVHSVLDATCPFDYRYREFKVGAGVSHPSEGDGLAILPEGGGIKLPAEQLFVSDYAASGLYAVDVNTAKFNTELTSFPRGL